MAKKSRFTLVDIVVYRRIFCAKNSYIEWMKKHGGYMKKIMILCLIYIILLRSVLLLVAGDTNPLLMKEKDLFSQAAVLMDATSGRVLYGKNEAMKLPMASTTKIMTCILALEIAKLDEVVTFSKYASTQPKVKLFASEGEQFVLGDLLYSLMLESHNDTAVAIAEHIGAIQLGMANALEDVKNRSQAESKRAVAAFIGLMNDKAKSLQCYDTYFITPNGLDATETKREVNGESIQIEHSSTAEDMAKILSYCILHSPQKEQFLEVTGERNYSFQNVNKTKQYHCQNHNAFLDMMQGAISGKTGYTGNAGYCYVGAVERDGRYFVVALLNSGGYGNKNRKWSDTKKLMNYGTENYTYKTVYEAGLEPKSIEVYNAKPNVEDYYGKVFVKTSIPDDRNIQFLMADWESVEIVLNIKKHLIAPVSKGQIVGGIEVKLNGEMREYLPIVSNEEIYEKTFIDSLKYVVYSYII